MDTLPNWLEPAQSTPVSQDTPTTTYHHTAGGISPYRELQFENLFESALDRLALGHQLIDICDDDPRQLSPAEFMRWIKKDKERYNQFKESQELAAEFLVYAALKAANGNDAMNDVGRDKLIAETSLKIAGAWSPKRYGREVGLPTTGGTGAITINIGQVESPYGNHIDIVPDDDGRVGLVSGVTDVEAKE
jgi:hypothetical protein